MSGTLVLYRWRAKAANTRTSWRELRWMMTEGDAARWSRINGIEVRKVEGSAEERHPIPLATSLTQPPGKEPTAS